MDLDDINWQAIEAEDWADVYFRRAFNGPEKAAIYERAGGKCEYCGKRVSRRYAQFDHVFPYVLGGTTTLDNAALSCRKCNRTKWANSDRDEDVAALFFRRVRKAVWSYYDDYRETEGPLKYLHLLR